MGRNGDHNQRSVMRLLYHISRQHFQLIHAALSDYDVYPGQPPLMFALARKNGRSQKELAAELEIKAATLTVMLNRMEKNGIVIRKSDEKDQRISRIFLTDKGFETLKIVEGILADLEREAVKGLSDEEIGIVGDLLTRIQHNVRSKLHEPGSANANNNDMKS